MKNLFFFLSMTALAIQPVFSQRDWSGPTGGEPLPTVLQSLDRSIDVAHFPKQNDPIKIKDKYYWKHATAIQSKTHPVTIIEYGAYLFYDGTWNLRARYPIKEFDSSFGTKKQRLSQAEPYVWVKNWRIDPNLYGGWALWYFIGITPDGQKVCGYETLHTTSNPVN